MSLDDTTRERITSFIGSHDVALFMKGVPEAPQCGFSQTVIRILDSLIPDYQTFDVLSDPEVRDGIKEFSSWPTIPQLYVKGEFIGGCDIVQELYASGELHQTLGVDASAPDGPPKLEISPGAAEALGRVSQQSGGPGREIHLGVDARRRTSLYFGPVESGEVEVECRGVRLYLDPLSAGRAEGAVIDVVDSPEGTGFRIELPEGAAPTAAAD